MLCASTTIVCLEFRQEKFEWPNGGIVSRKHLCRKFLFCFVWGKKRFRKRPENKCLVYRTWILMHKVIVLFRGKANRLQVCFKELWLLCSGISQWGEPICSACYLMESLVQGMRLDFTTAVHSHHFHHSFVSISNMLKIHLVLKKIWYKKHTSGLSLIKLLG